MQADLKTILTYGVLDMNAIAVLATQDTANVRSIQGIKPDILAGQINMMSRDISPVVVKIGMISATDIIDVIAGRLTFHHTTNVVLDPIMVVTFGASLIGDDTIAVLTSKLFPMATAVILNTLEAKVLTGALIRDQGDMEAAAHCLMERYSCAALARGDHDTEDTNDMLAETDGTVAWFNSARINDPSMHDTGCTLSSAIASYLALGDTLSKAIKRVRRCLTGALKAQLDLDRGSGPIDHFWRYR